MQPCGTDALTSVSDLEAHAGNGIRLAAKVVLIAVMAQVNAGCAAIPLKRLQAIIGPPTGTCKSGQVKSVELENGAEFHYVLPSGGISRHGSTVSLTFEDYRAKVQAIVQAKMPPGLQQHKVTNAFADFLTSASGQAQLDAQVADRTLTDIQKITAERESIQKRSPPVKLTHGEMKDFSDKLFDLVLKTSPASLTGLPLEQSGLSAKEVHLANSRPALDKTLVAYLDAYYHGKFADRMGTVADKFEISTKITDSEIAAAETVLLEFLMDLIDPTPVMGDDPEASISTTTTYYPGNSTNKPTAYSTGLARYVQIPNPASATDPDFCGITTKNAWVLKDLANGASDQAAAVGGLVANTPGGISLGLGVLGKISIGDNQTLSTLVKTAASRVALRAALASSYWTLRRVKFNISEPGS
jgi:hypothetical protein